ncbi:MAG: glycosyltransferase family 4 protein [Clostridia bacterium]
MAKILFLLNESPPNREKYYCKDPIKVSNFVYPNSMVLKDMGIEQYMGISRKYATSIECVNAPIKFLDIPIYRNIFDFKNIIKAYKRINRAIEELGIEYIHCNTPIGGFLGRVCGKRCKVKKVIYTAHGFHFYKGAPFLNWLVFYPIERFLARWTDIILTINEEDYNRACSFKLRNQGNVFKIPGVGIDVKKINLIEGKREVFRRELKISEKSLIVLSVGELNRNKNNIVIIKALAKLKNPNIHYVLCGIGPKKNYLQTKARKYGIEHNTHFLGFRKDIVEIIKSSDIFVLPSLREGLPRSLMEAMACGLPCVVSNIRGNVDLIEHNYNGYLCDPKKADDYANAISMLVKDANQRDAMGIENSKRILRYDVSSVVKELSEIYKCLQ